MISKLTRLPMLLGIGPVLNTLDSARDIPANKYKVPKFDDNETGWDRVKRMFSEDDFGRMSEELNSIYQAAFLGMFVGGIYGGFVGSRKSYMDFMERNQATAFENHLDAKRKLQDQVTMGFAKNSFRFGWRLALFTTSYTALTTTVAVYRGKSSMVEYITAGAVTGALYKFNLGLKGMTAGMLVGGALGTVAGGITLLILRTTGMTMEEARYWQYKWRSNRDNTIHEGLKKNFNNDPHLMRHDKKYGEDQLDIKFLAQDEDKKETAKAPVTDKK